nr:MULTISPECIES: glycine betaine ABC transporter substrate-binding protein [Myxococcaceae]
MLLLALLACSHAQAPTFRVGSKKFTESVLLGELAAQVAASAGARVEHRRELGGTRVLWEALLRGELDAYPEYTGTLRQELFAGQQLPDDAALAGALGKVGVRMSRPLGFNNTYALGMRESEAERLGIRRISDLRRHPALALGFSNEFMGRADGWRALAQRYGLSPARVTGLDHDLAYRALVSNAIQVTDLYSTDPEVKSLSLRVLEDDLHHFPAYDAVLLTREAWAHGAPEVAHALARLEGALDAPTMVALNARAQLEHVPEAQVARDFLQQRLGLAPSAAARSTEPRLVARLLQRTREHLTLVGVSLLAALLVSLPLGVLAARRPRLGQAVLAGTGLLQTVPSLALLVLLIPLLGIGARPAIAALFLYSLLPIVRSTAAGLASIPADVRESAEALGLPPRTQLWRVELPLASRSVLAGVKTAAIINVGTATLGALVGAGGYGQPILSGIRLANTALLLEGAVPAALLALSVHALFEGAERLLVPRGLRGD